MPGDIAPVGGYPNWIRQCAAGSGVNVLTPLWEMERQDLLRRVLAAGFRVVFSCVKRPWLEPEWAGRALSADAIDELVRRAAISGLDASGEQGEYHTLVLDGPIFRRTPRLEPATWVRRTDGDLTYLDAGVGAT